MFDPELSRGSIPLAGVGGLTQWQASTLVCFDETLSCQVLSWLMHGFDQPGCTASCARPRNLWTRGVRAKLAGCVVLCGIALLTCPASSEEREKQGSLEKSKHELLDLEDRWLRAEDDPDALESILAPDFLHVVPAGIITKDQQLSFVRKHPSPGRGSRHFEEIHVRVYGSVGIVNGVVVATDAGGRQKTLFTDVFAYRNGKWQAVSAQELPARETGR